MKKNDKLYVRKVFFISKLTLALVLITAVGILLAQEVNPNLIWITPVISAFAGFFAIGLVDRSLRRKAYAAR